MRVDGEDHLLYDASGRLIRNTLTTAQLDSLIRKELYGGGGGASNPYEQIGWYYACILIIATQFSTLVPKCWQFAAGRGGAKPNYEEVYPPDLMAKLDRPEENLSGVRWLQQWATKLWDMGTVCAIIEPSTDGNPLPNLILYGPDRLEPVRKGRVGPLIGWKMRRIAGMPVDDVPTYDTSEVLHWALPNPYDDVLGMAPKHVLRASLDADFARTIYDRSYYQKGANPSGILKNKYRLSPEQRAMARKAYDEAYGGAGNAGKMMLLDGEWDYTPITFMHSQSQFAEVRKLTREEIAASFGGFPVGFLNSQEAGGLSRAGEEADRLKLYENNIFPLGKLFEPEYNHKYVTKARPVGRRRAPVVMEFDKRACPVALTYAKTESEIFKTYVNGGMPPDQVIDSLNLPFDHIPGGEVGLVNKNLIPMEVAAEVGEAEPVDNSSGTGPDDAEDATEDAPNAASLADARREADAPYGVFQRRLRQKLRSQLYAIRVLALREPSRALTGLEREERVEWARHILPCLIGAAQVAADRRDGGSLEYLATAAADLEEMQRQIGTLPGLRDAKVEQRCIQVTRRVVGFLDRTIREAAAGDARTYMGRLDQAARLMAERAIRQVVDEDSGREEAA